MLISRLRPSRRSGTPQRVAGNTRHSRIVLDLSGPISPAANARPSGAPATPLPYLQTPQDAAALRAAARRNRPTEMSDLPRDQDPFERDWPWGGDHGAVVGSDQRSSTFEEDLRRVLEIFAA